MVVQDSLIPTPAEEAAWRQLIEQRCGNCFADTRLYVLRGALRSEMERHGRVSFQDFYDLVERDAAAWSALLERLVNRDTTFFRHAPSFSALAEEVLPAILTQRRRLGGGRVSLWSAACSSGEEAYSLALAAGEVLGPAFCGFEVLGSDVSSEALGLARAARYSERSVAGIPQALRQRHLTRTGTYYEMATTVRHAVTFQPFNLVEPASYPSRPQDVIFCQNVLIYFRDPLRLKALEWLASCLRPGGFLLTGPGELAGVSVPGLECCRLRDTTVLRRV